MPRVLKDLGAKAIEKHERRQATPQLKVTVENGKWWFGSPYAPENDDHWTALLFAAFGTRSQGTFRTFMCQLSELCSTDWNEDEGAWHPAEDELIAAVQIVRSTKPRNEAEACLAAQMVAVHLMQMKLSAQALTHSWPEPRTCAIASKLARTYAMQLETMAKLRGKGSRQRITVRKYSQHEHKHIHLHQGGGENGNQPHGPTGTAEINAALEPPPCSTLPSKDATRNAVPMPGNKGEAEVPAARRRKGVGSAER
jgi:hypothetical protein